MIRQGIQAEKDDFAEIGADPRYRQEANLRLQMQKLLPENVSRILWLDADIIVNGNIQSNTAFLPFRHNYGSMVFLLCYNAEFSPP